MPHLPIHRSAALAAILSLLIAAVCAGGGLAALQPMPETRSAGE